MIVSTNCVSQVIATLECGKVTGSDGICAEYLKFSHAKIHTPLGLCFALCIWIDLIETTIVPIVKNKSGNFSDCNNYYILSIISAMKNSAPGFNELPAFLMKQCSKLFIKPLCHVLSLSIRQRVFPIELKLAKVLPIYKSDDKHQLKNYRPISVLPFI